MRKSLSKLAFAAAVAGALGFGGSQAFAAPGAPAEKAACNFLECRRQCREFCPTCYAYCDSELGCVCEYI